MAENLFEEKNSWKLPKCGERNRNPDPGGIESPQQNQPKEVHTMTHSNYNGKKLWQIENLKTTRKRKVIYIQRKPHKAICCSFKGNFACPEEVAWYIQSAERKKTLQPRILYPARLSFRIEGEI